MKRKTLFAPRAMLSCGLLSSSILATGVLPATAAPGAATSPPTTPRAPASSSASTPARKPATKPAPSVAITDIPVAAEVAGDKIMMADLNRLIDSIVQDYPELAANTPESQKALKQLRDERLENMIALQLFYQEAKRLNITPGKVAVDREVVHFYDAMRLQNDAAIQKWLAADGKTEADVRTLVTKRLTVEMYKRTLLTDLKVSDTDISQYYTTHKAEFVIPETVVARQIQVSFPKEATDSDKDKTKQKAQGLLKKAQAANADFEALAKTSSDDKLSARRGGVVDVIMPDWTVRPLTREDKPLVESSFFDALFSAPVGKVYPKLVETKFGYHIIKVEDRKPSRTLALTEVTQYIKPLILETKAKDRLDNKVKELRGKTVIRKYI